MRRATHWLLFGPCVRTLGRLSLFSGPDTHLCSNGLVTVLANCVLFKMSVFRCHHRRVDIDTFKLQVRRRHFGNIDWQTGINSEVEKTETLLLVWWTQSQSANKELECKQEPEFKQEETHSKMKVFTNPVILGTRDELTKKLWIESIIVLFWLVPLLATRLRLVSSNVALVKIPDK